MRLHVNRVQPLADRGPPRGHDRRGRGARSPGGHISVGAAADLVVVEGRPDVDLAILTRPSSIVEVMRSGIAVS
jgi:hypothetical protein